jgi:hypothetical protein
MLASMAGGAVSVKGAVTHPDRSDHAELCCIAAFNLSGVTGY